MSKSPKTTCSTIGVPCSLEHQSTRMLSGFTSGSHNQRKLLKYKIQHAKRDTYVDPILVVELLHRLASAVENLFDCGLRKILVVSHQGQQSISDVGVD